MAPYKPTTKRANAPVAGRSRGTAKRRSIARPYSQGDLDGLCGVYAIVNAVAHLCPTIKSADSERLFAAILRALRAQSGPRTSFVTAGIELPQVLCLMEIAFKHVKRRHGITLVARLVPKPIAKRWGIDTMWQHLAKRFDERCVAILGLGGRHDHWTLAAGITPRQIKLKDSDGLHRLNRAHCGTRGSSQRRSVITADMVILVRRLGRSA